MRRLAGNSSSHVSTPTLLIVPPNVDLISVPVGVYQSSADVIFFAFSIAFAPFLYIVHDCPSFVDGTIANELILPSWV